MLKRKGRGGVKGVLSNVKKNCRIRKQVHPLWKDPATKSDEFLEKVQTAFDPPPSLLGNYIATFFYNGYGRIYATRHRPDSIS